ncbi:MAG: gfo/Idh/MocA family oxidoreductase [Planctomycetaceae bacterium]|nr:MAG: gfo/Idh/MocA family oxidoreductase [Planctomycetaceae bacterium]
MEPLKVGIVGAAGRGKSFRAGLEANGAIIHAVCDTAEDKLAAAATTLGASEKYTDYEKMLDHADIQAVVVGTPMQFHVPHSIAAIQRGLHVMCEVPAGVSVQECRQLVQACKESKAVYMMAENYIYTKTNMLITSLAAAGLFGQVFYAEGEYLHELKELNEVTKWRRQWQTGIAGITYGTHSLGPILQWMPGDRVTRVCCETTGSHYCDPRGEKYAQDSATMLGKTDKGGLVKIRVDMISDRPHAMNNYQLQGTDGCYESGRGGLCDKSKLWTKSLRANFDAWMDVETLLNQDDFIQKYLPESWKNPPEAMLAAGHGGGDYLQVCDWVKAIRQQISCPIGIHEAMDMTLPGLVSQQSALEDGKWLDVPDSRTW